MKIFIRLFCIFPWISPSHLPSAYKPYLPFWQPPASSFLSIPPYSCLVFQRLTPCNMVIKVNSGGLFELKSYGKHRGEMTRREDDDVSEQVSSTGCQLTNMPSIHLFSSKTVFSTSHQMWKTIHSHFHFLSCSWNTVPFIRTRRNCLLRWSEARRMSCWIAIRSTQRQTDWYVDSESESSCK